MKSILILTSAYPFLPGEQFFELEAQYWNESDDVQNVFILPSRAEGQPRDYPKNLVVINQYKQQKSSIKIFSRIMRGLFYKQFWIEVKTIISNVKGLKNKVVFARKLLSIFNEVIEREDVISDVLRAHSDIKLIYSYWSHHAFYGAVFAKRKFPSVKLITRTHGYDLYVERAPHRYVPLKRHCFLKADKIFSLSEIAKEYISDTYDVPSEKIEPAKLGVDLSKPLEISKKCSLEENGIVHILTIGRCEPVKRIDIAARVLADYANKNPDRQIIWHHIGSGRLFDAIREYSKQLEGELTNFKATFYGELAHDEILEFISGNFFHCGLNTSESEGVPVAIMEMMSAGIPCVAPNIGGMSSLILESNGILLNSQPSIDEYVNAIQNLLQEAKQTDLRAAARQHIYDQFNAASNYNSFISAVNHLTEFELTNEKTKKTDFR